MCRWWQGDEYNKGHYDGPQIVRVYDEEAIEPIGWDCFTQVDKDMWFWYLEPPPRPDE